MAQLRMQALWPTEAEVRSGATSEPQGRQSLEFASVCRDLGVVRLWDGPRLPT